MPLWMLLVRAAECIGPGKNTSDGQFGWKSGWDQSETVYVRTSENKRTPRIEANTLTHNPTGVHGFFAHSNTMAEKIKWRIVRLLRRLML